MILMIGSLLFSSPPRHPETSGRPTFPDIMQRLSLPDTKLLKWSEEDKATDPEAATLGADLDAGLGLYKDIQERYIIKEGTNDTSRNNHDEIAQSYEDPVLVGEKTAALSPVLSAEPNICNNTFHPQAKECDNTTNDIVHELPTHSYEDPMLLSALADKDTISRV